MVFGIIDIPTADYSFRLVDNKLDRHKNRNSAHCDDGFAVNNMLKSNFYSAPATTITISPFGGVSVKYRASSARVPRCVCS